MSTRKYSTLTPYIKVTGTIEKTKIMVKRSCPNHPNIKQPDAKFCSQCGSEIVSTDYPVTKQLTPKDFLWNHKDYEDDRLNFPAYSDVLLPNKTNPYRFGNRNQEDSFDVDLIGKQPMIDKQMEWFNAEYAKEIQILIEGFGEDKVKICWGLVSYWS